MPSFPSEWLPTMVGLAGREKGNHYPFIPPSFSFNSKQTAFASTSRQPKHGAAGVQLRFPLPQTWNYPNYSHSVRRGELISDSHREDAHTLNVGRWNRGKEMVGVGRVVHGVVLDVAG